MELPPPPPGAPGMFRCAKDDLISGIFIQAGLNNISVKEVTGKMNCKTADVYWNSMTEVAAPVVAALSKTDESMSSKIKSKVFQKVNEKYSDGNVMINSSALVIFGEK